MFFVNNIKKILLQYNTNEPQINLILYSILNIIIIAD